MTADLDILAALGEAPARGAKTCRLQTSLDAIPADAKGRAQLIHAIECHDARDDEYRSAAGASLVMSRLGTPVSENLVNDHRAKRCRCYK